MLHENRNENLSILWGNAFFASSWCVTWFFIETLELDSWWRRLGFEIGLKQEGELWLERLLHSFKRLKNYSEVGKIVILQPSRNNPLFQLTEVRTDLCIGHINLDAYIRNISIRIRKLILIKISKKYLVTVNKSGIIVR